MEQLRRDLRCLGAVELAARVIGLGVLIAIALFAIVTTEEPGASAILSIGLGLALVYLAIAFRFRVGASQVSRDLWSLERTDRESPIHGDPYRSASAPSSRSHRHRARSLTAR